MGDVMILHQLSSRFLIQSVNHKLPELIQVANGRLTVACMQPRPITKILIADSWDGRCTRISWNCDCGLSEAVNRYVTALLKSNTSNALRVKTLADGALLEGNDKVADVIDDGDHVAIIFKDWCGGQVPPPLIDDCYSKTESPEGKTNCTAHPTAKRKKRKAAKASLSDPLHTARKRNKLKFKRKSGSVGPSQQTLPDLRRVDQCMDMPGYRDPDWIESPREVARARQLLEELRDGGRSEVETIRIWAEKNPLRLRDVTFTRLCAFTAADENLTPREVMLWQRKTGYYYFGSYTKEEAEE